MKRNMYNWLEEIKASKIKKALPVLSFPAITKMGVDVIELINDSTLQAKAMKTIADECDTAASVSFMDLSVEAETFGAQIRFSPDEVPTVIGQLVDTEEDANALKVPNVGEGRTGFYMDAIRKSVDVITDRPILAGIIGPFSLSGRLMDLTEIMVKCYTEPEIAHIVLKKATEFLTKYALAYKEIGANGVVIAEPAAGLLGPDLCDEFSSHYVKQIIDAVQDENFIVVYHNCGNTIPLVNSIMSTGAKICHFGNAIKMADMMKLIPSDIVACGNVSPADQFRNGTPESIYKATTDILNECGGYNNFVISSGCDIPPLSAWANIDSFFKAVSDYYANK